MSRWSQATFWFITLAVFLLALWLLSSILLPFLLGITFAYFLDPAATWLERRGVSRTVGTTIMSVAFFGAGFLILLLLLPVLVKQSIDLFERLPGLASTFVRSIEPYLDQAAAIIGTTQPQGFHETLAGGIEKMASVALTVFQGLLGGGVALINIVSLLAITPLTTFYLLLNWPRIIHTLDDWLPRDHAETVRGIVRDINFVLTGFVHGAVTVCAALAVFYSVALSLVGLAYGLMIGLIAGAISFIPYVGTIFGLVASVGVAFIQFWPNWIMVAVVLGIFVAGQLAADYVLTPRIMGSKVAVHPLWLIFGLFAGGALFGFVGMLLSVPATAAIGVLARFGIRQYKASGFYRGESGDTSGTA